MITIDPSSTSLFRFVLVKCLVVLVIETQIATEKTTWTLILEGPSQKLSALQSLAIFRQYALHICSCLAQQTLLLGKSWQNVAIPSSCPCGGPTCVVVSPCLDPWARCDIVTRSCDVVVVHWYTMLWFIFVTLLLYTL